MTVRWTVRAANDRSRVARQESNPVSSSTPPKTQGFRGFYFYLAFSLDRIPKLQFFSKGCGLIMSRIITMNRTENKTFEEVFSMIIISRTAKGETEATIRNYHQHLHYVVFLT